MPRRTTIEIDDELVTRVKRALGHATARATVEDALRAAADHAEGEHAERVSTQERFFDALGERVDVSALSSEEMWR